MSVTRALVEKGFVSDAANAPIVFKLVLPNQVHYQNRDGTPQLTITFKRWSTLLKSGLLGSYGIATDYLTGNLDIEGDLRYLGQLMYADHDKRRLPENLKASRWPNPWLGDLLNWWHMQRTMPSTYEQAMRNSVFHYGHEPEFYDYYLGSTKAYSTGFWYPWTKTVEEAQYNKWGLILKKLRLQPGMRIASLGSGFGYGEMMAAREYGVLVDCYNNTRSQNVWLRAELKRQGLDDKVTVYDADYREIKHKKDHYDGLLFIECIEHAGQPFRRETLRYAIEAMKTDAVAVVQYLSYPVESEVTLFIRECLYPGVDMPPLGGLLDDIVWCGGEVQDVICNRRHYHYTLNAWYDNFLQNWDKIVAIDPDKYNEKMMRTWSLYLSSGSYYLSVPNATARLFQVTFTRGVTDTYPMNRNFLYEEAADDSAWVKPTTWVFQNN